jgi:cbb3-type cytochrome oxidase maturation protein
VEVLFVIVPFAIAFAGAALMSYVWAVRSGQFDDMTTPANQVIADGWNEQDATRARSGIPGALAEPSRRRR